MKHEQKDNFINLTDKCIIIYHFNRSPAGCMVDEIFNSRFNQVIRNFVQE